MIFTNSGHDQDVFDLDVLEDDLGGWCFQTVGYDFDENILKNLKK